MSLHQHAVGKRVIRFTVRKVPTDVSFLVKQKTTTYVFELSTVTFAT